MHALDEVGSFTNVQNTRIGQRHSEAEAPDEFHRTELMNLPHTAVKQLPAELRRAPAGCHGPVCVVVSLPRVLPLFPGFSAWGSGAVVPPLAELPLTSRLLGISGAAAHKFWLCDGQD